MGTGYLTVTATAGNSALPIGGATVNVSRDGIQLHTMTTDENGGTDSVPIEAPDKSTQLDPYYEGRPYVQCDIAISAAGFVTKVFYGAMISDEQTTILPVNMTPMAAYDYIDDADMNIEVPDPQRLEEIFLPEHNMKRPQEPQKQEYPNFTNVNQRVLPAVVIPRNVRVHLGTPTSNATNVTVPFKDYIKNVATHEIYSNWPEASLEANILCQISLLLNRVYTEWYRSRGYSFDITNSTRYDQYFVYQGAIAQNISVIVDRIFNRFVQREGHREPFYTEYCNGTTATCPGLSQWGTVSLANRGYAPLEILRYYYPRDILIVETNNMQDVQESFPGYPLTQGMSGESVRAVQNMLNRIRVDYPVIPQINPPDGVFGAQTYNAVRAFQGVSSFALPVVNGVVDRTTWFKIVYIYTAVKKLAELTSEGQVIGVGRTPPTVTIGSGSRGTYVGRLQFLINFISFFYPEIPSVIQDYSFGTSTLNAVREFQRAFGLTADGFVGRTTWAKLFEVYWRLNDDIDIPNPPLDEFPGTPLTVGSSGPAVTRVQTCLNNIAARYPSIPTITVDGQFGSATRDAVMALQRVFGLTADGVVGPVTWAKIISECGGGTVPPPTEVPPYPGTPLRLGSAGESVRQIQTCLNNLTGRYPTIPKLVVDGQFGPITQSAVVAFQRIMGLTQDGIVGPITWNSLMSECGGTPPAIPPYPGAPLRIGSSGANVRQIQTCLNNISASIPTIPTLVVDGQFGNNTHNAVVAFQRALELTPDGIVGPITWNRIMSRCFAAGLGLDNGGKTGCGCLDETGIGFSGGVPDYGSDFGAECLPEYAPDYAPDKPCAGSSTTELMKLMILYNMLGRGGGTGGKR